MSMMAFIFFLAAKESWPGRIVSKALLVEDDIWDIFLY